VVVVIVEEVLVVVEEEVVVVEVEVVVVVEGWVVADVVHGEPVIDGRRHPPCLPPSRESWIRGERRIPCESGTRCDGREHGKGPVVVVVMRGNRLKSRLRYRPTP
jgi:hypothetical protein